jgi:hypothetical protein
MDWTVTTKARGQQPQAHIPPVAEAPLSPARAFVVQFREETEPAGNSFRGRVEHMITGHAARFESAKELLAFLVRVLSALQSKPPEER